jgi:hypothetical protein
MIKVLSLIGAVLSFNIQAEVLKYSNDGEFDLTLDDPETSYGFYETRIPSINDVDLPPDAFKTMDWLCEKNGYLWEEYSVTTTDGYILSLWRIPGKKGSQEIGSPVLLQHCLDCDMMVWVVNDPELAPAFNIVNAGYDVWLGNNRGTKYGLNHTTLRNDS